MLPLETKQSGGKLLPDSDLWVGVFLGEISSSSSNSSCRRYSKKDYKENKNGTRKVRILNREGKLEILKK